MIFVRESAAGEPRSGGTSPGERLESNPVGFGHHDGQEPAGVDQLSNRLSLMCANTQTVLTFWLKRIFGRFLAHSVCTSNIGDPALALPQLYKE